MLLMILQYHILLEYENSNNGKTAKLWGSNIRSQEKETMSIIVELSLEKF